MSASLLSTIHRVLSPFITLKQNTDIEHQGNCHQEDRGNDGHTSGQENGERDAGGEGACITLLLSRIASISSRQVLATIWRPPLDRYKVPAALAAEWKDTLHHLPSLQPFDHLHPNLHLLHHSSLSLPLPAFPLPGHPLPNLLPLRFPLLDSPPPILKQRVPSLPLLDAAQGRIMKIRNNRRAAVLRSGHGLTHLECLLAWGNCKARAIWS